MATPAVKGDTAKLEKLRVKIQLIGNGNLQTALKKNLGEEAVALVKFGFRGSRDPYGNPWQSIVHRIGKPLIDTGRLRNSFNSRVMPNGFRIGTNVKYAPYHQDGTRGLTKDYSREQAIDKHGRFVGTGDGKRDAHGRFLKKDKRKKRIAVGMRKLNFKAGRGVIAARPMVPTESMGGLGPIWTRAFRDASGVVFKKFFR